MNPNKKLLESILKREKKTEFNYGILTADHYVKTIEECIGSDLCYRYAASKSVSFADVLKKAAETLTYNNPDMVLEEKLGTDYAWKDEDGDERELPKNTLMVFRHTLTTPRKDRDGDILRSEGAKLDPKMLLLWQHVHTLPIGKLLQVEKQTSEGVSVTSAIVDLNQLAHDSAVMIDNKMGRFSHGFSVLDFEKFEDESGFDIKSYEVMEESLVSIPSNVDAEVSEVLVDLVEGGKLKSGIMKEVGKSFRSKMPARIPVEIDLKVNVSQNENKSGDRSSETEGKAGCGCKGAPEETNEVTGKEREAENKEVKPKEKMYIGSLEVEGSWEWIRMSLQGQAKKFLQAQHVDFGKEPKWAYVCVVATYPDHAIVELDKSYGEEEVYYWIAWEDKEGKPAFTGQAKQVELSVNAEFTEKRAEVRKSELESVKTSESMAIFLAKANKGQRQRMMDVLKSIESSEKQENKLNQYRRFKNRHVASRAS